MRISDWSSDVCSSDLLLQQCHEVDDLAGAFVRCRLGLDLGTDLRALALESRPDRTAELLAEFILVLIRLETAAHRLDELACHRQFLVIDAEALEAARWKAIIVGINDLDRKSTRLNSSH